MLILKSTHRKEVTALREAIKVVKDGCLSIDQDRREKQLIIMKDKVLIFLLLSVLGYVVYKYVL